MRKISNLLITLGNGKGEELIFWIKKNDKARKTLGHWKKLEEIKVLKQFPVSVETTIKTLDAIFTVGVTQKEALMLYPGVYRPKVE